MDLRERIIKEANKHFFELGIRNVTMDEIALSLGISKRTIYETFKDKTELIQICLDEIKQEQEIKNHEIISNSANVIEATFAFMKEGIKAINSINPVFFFDLKRFYPSIWKSKHEENKQKAYNMTHKLLRKGVNEGLFRKDINLNIVSKLFHEQMNLISDEKIFPRNEYSRSEVFQNMVINFMRGISTNKGIELIDNHIE